LGVTGSQDLGNCCRRTLQELVVGRLLDIGPEAHLHTAKIGADTLEHLGQLLWRKVGAEVEQQRMQLWQAAKHTEY
jgi:hypothetical protein